MNFFKWVGSKMGFFKKDDGKINAKAVAATGGTGLVTAAMVSAAVFLAQTTEVGAPMTAEFEGMVLENYIDTVGVETWCIGETQMGRLEEGYTAEYCKTLFYARYPQYAAQLYACYNDKAKRYVTPAMHAGFTDVFYNTGAKCGTGMVRNLKAGKPVQACEKILAYRKVRTKVGSKADMLDGKANGWTDCSLTKGMPQSQGGCYGVYARRLPFYEICINDAKQLPPEGIGAND